MFDAAFQRAIVLLIQSNKYNININNGGNHYLNVYILFVWLFCLHTCLYYKGAHERLKRLSDSPGIGGTDYNMKILGICPCT